MKAFDILIIGGGIAGIRVAALLRKKLASLSIGIIEPSGNHFYQPAFTLVGLGLADRSTAQKSMAEVVPKGCNWIRDAVTEIDPQHCMVSLSSGERIAYRALIIAAGLALDVESTPGLAESLSDRQNPVCSLYDSNTHDKCRTLLQNFAGGTMLFTLPSTPVKCPSTALKSVFLIDDLLRQSGMREVCKLVYITPFSFLSNIESAHFVAATNAHKKGIEIILEHELNQLDTRNYVAIFAATPQQTGAAHLKNLKYDFALITPRMKAPSFLIHSGLIQSSGAMSGWLNVDPQTLQHPQFANIFGLGDCAALPTLKTASAGLAQAEIVAANLASLFKKGVQVQLPATYDGYSACPLFTEFGKAIPGAVTYQGVATGSFWQNPNQPSRREWFVHRYLIPTLYWNFTIKGIV